VCVVTRGWLTPTSQKRSDDENMSTNTPLSQATLATLLLRKREKTFLLSLGCIYQLASQSAVKWVKQTDRLRRFKVQEAEEGLFSGFWTAIGLSTRYSNLIHYYHVFYRRVMSSGRSEAQNPTKVSDVNSIFTFKHNSLQCPTLFWSNIGD